jgi:hypothetical protein
MENKILYAVQLREDAISLGYEGEGFQEVEMAFPRNFEKMLIPLGKCERTKNYLMFAANVNKLLDKAKYLYVDKGYETCLDDEIIVRLNLSPAEDIDGDYISKVFALTTDLDKAQKYANSNPMQINDEPPRTQPAIKVIWDDDGKCALLISPVETTLQTWLRPRSIQYRDSRGVSLKEAFPFIRWDVVDRNAHFGSVKDKLEYYKGALEAVERKLSNPKFKELASDKVVALNEKRRQRIKEKIADLEGQ